MRLDRFLANAGIGTRKEVKVLIKSNRIKVNDEIIKSNDYSIDEYKDIVYLDNKKIDYHLYYYFLLNKPAGYLSATEDNLGPTVLDLIPEYNFVNLFPVGRLDKDTTGLLLLTNNGPLAHRLLSPKYHVDKKYFVETDYTIKDELIKKFEDGVMIEGELTLPAKLEIIDDTHAYLTIHQGKFHQVKKMFKAYGLTVMKLQRVSFAFLNLDNIKEGTYRPLTNDEIEKLLKY